METDNAAEQVKALPPAFEKKLFSVVRNSSWLS
jgi:hypothetical protein